ncbi:MAG TPA: tetratricopeptide repeat protein [Vicinamibacterales bacterium]|nr:tetratricopeptide repeat protein [Vicinamibacterales bacterium]
MRWAVAVLCVVVTLSPVLRAQEGGALVEEARRLRDRGEFAQALVLLERRLAEQPDDGDAARLQAQTLYWLKQTARAREAYALALARHPDDTQVRVEYAAMLAEIGELRQARSTLEQVLELSPGHPEATRQLLALRTRTAPWLQLSTVFWHDDQPLDQLAVAISAGWFVTPPFSVTLRSRPTRFESIGARTFWRHEVDASYTAPGGRLEATGWAGLLRRGADAPAVSGIGGGSVAVRMDHGLVARARVERAPYLHTVASLDVPVMTRTATALVQWDHARGWLAEAALQRQAFPDTNAVTSRHVWVLAPLVRTNQALLRAGYAFGLADAEQDRFTPAGVYSPYYTPDDVVTHAAAASLTVGRGAGPLFTAGGSYGFRASENATSFSAVGTQRLRVISRREFTPWTLRASFELPLSEAVRLSGSGETGRTAFFQWATAGVHLTYRFLPRMRAVLVDGPASGR